MDVSGLKVQYFSRDNLTLHSFGNERSYGNIWTNEEHKSIL